MNITAVEANWTLYEILQGKGYNVIQGDFLEKTFDQEFDRVIMNSPFENKQDIDHVQHAYTFLSEMGRLVAVMSAGTFYRSDNKTTAFRDWLDSLGAEVVDLPDNAFKESGTGVATKLVIIDKF